MYNLLWICLCSSYSLLQSILYHKSTVNRNKWSSELEAVLIRRRAACFLPPIAQSVFSRWIRYTWYFVSVRLCASDTLTRASSSAGVPPAMHGKLGPRSKALRAVTHALPTAGQQLPRRCLVIATLISLRQLQSTHRMKKINRA